MQIINTAANRVRRRHEGQEKEKRSQKKEEESEDQKKKDSCGPAVGLSADMLFPLVVYVVLLAEPGRPAGSPLSVSNTQEVSGGKGEGLDLVQGHVPGTQWAWPSLLAHVSRFVRSQQRATGHLGMALALLEAAVAHIISHPAVSDGTM